jgi:SAM-dependent methyltransferase
MKRKSIRFNERLPCIICGNEAHHFVYSGYDRFFDGSEVFSIIECTLCGLFSLRPRLPLEKMKKYYPNNYQLFVQAVEDETNYFRFLDRYWGREKQVKQVIKRVSDPGVILDVGCATGILLSGMRRRGWDCYGVEPNQYAANYAQQRFDLKIFCGYLENANYPEKFFDVITMMDVLEHVFDPINTIREIHRILKPGGYFIGNLPNGNAWERFLFGPYWVGWEAPRHYHVFTPKTIKKILEDQHFRSVNIFSYIGRHGTFMVSLKFWIASWQQPKRIKKIVMKVFGSLLVRILLFPVFYLLERVNKSTILSFSAKKHIG